MSEVNMDKFNELASHGRCDVCGKETNVVVYASKFGPISHSYCIDCMTNDLEPYSSIVAYISTVVEHHEDEFEKHISEHYVDLINKNLEFHGKTRDQFVQDLINSNKIMNDYFSKSSKGEHIVI